MQNFGVRQLDTHSKEDIMPDNTTNIKVAGYQRGVAEVGCKTAHRLENEMKQSWHTQRMVVYRGLIANISSAP